MSKVLYQVVQKMKKTDIKRWYRFIESPYFNTNPRLIVLAKLLVKYRDKMDSLSKEKIFKIVYPKQSKFNFVTINRTINRLEKLTLSFIQQQKFEENQAQKDINLLLGIYEIDFLAIPDFMDNLLKEKCEVVEKKAIKNTEDYFFLINAYGIWQAWEVSKEYLGVTIQDFYLTQKRIEYCESFYFNKISEELPLLANQMVKLGKQEQYEQLFPRHIRLILEKENYYVDNVIFNISLVLVRLLLNINRPVTY